MKKNISNMSGKAKADNKLSDVKLSYIKSYIQGNHLLDVGAGQCHYSSWIKKNYPNVIVHAIDHHTTVPEEQIFFMQADLEKTITIVEESFQTILAFDIIEHISHDAQLLQELYRICKKGGILIGSVPHDDDKFLPAYNLTFYHRSDLTHKRYYLPESLKSSLEQAGFSIVRIDKQGGVSPQVIAEFFPSYLQFPIKKMVGLLRRAKLINSCVLSSDLFFVAKKA